jgi:F0F1-type ATP synthase epsilon subunit
MDAEEGKAFAFVIKSPAGVLFKHDGLRSVRLDLRDGKIGIRAGHAAMIAEVISGEAELDDGENVRKITHHSGIVVVRDDAVMIYTDSLDARAANTDTGVDHSEAQFDDEVYEAIMASLLPDSTQAESQHGD